MKYISWLCSCLLLAVTLTAAENTPNGTDSNGGSRRSGGGRSERRMNGGRRGQFMEQLKSKYPKEFAEMEKLRESDRWDTLPDALRQTAQLRLDYPDANLVELALLHQPVLTKSGLNHRLQKLKALTEGL